MGFLTNLGLRRKLLISIAPLALMVVAAGVYSSIESKTIEAGDRFVLYTDGIPETNSPAREEFGTDRLVKFMETNNN